MLLMKNVSKSFKGRQVIDGLDLTVMPGERIAIIGPSGCGKSTLLRLILGLQKSDSGLIKIGDTAINHLSQSQLRLVRMQFGMLFQSAALFDSLTVEENVAFPLIETFGYENSDKIARLVQEKLELVGMSESGHRMPSELSGGQRKRVGLARAIVANPKVVLYDEPTTGLDPILSTSIEDLIVKLNTHFQMTSIVVTHQISTILRTADKIYLMQNGRLLPAETPASLSCAHPAYLEFLKGHIGVNDSKPS